MAAGLVAFLLGKAILRLRGAYFALATIGVNAATLAFIENFEPFGGPIGMSLDFKVYRSYGGSNQALWMTYWAMVALSLVVVLVSYLVKASRFGLGLMAIRENEDAASGGEQQMLAVARGLMTQPEILMIDELALGLAPLLVLNLFQVLQRLKVEGLTVLLVEQNVQLALAVSDYAYVLADARVEQVRKAYLGI